MNIKIQRYITLILLISTCVFSQIDRSKPPLPGPAPEIKIGDYESFKLKNGLNVYVVENHKLPRVSIALGFRQDPLLEEPHAGYIDITGQLLRTGTKSRTKAQLDEEVDFIGGTLFTSPDMIYAESLKKHFNKMLDIFADVILNPEFRQEELDRIKKQTQAGLAFAKDKPDIIAGNIQDLLNFGSDHPYGEIVTESSVKSVDLEICRQFIKTYFSPDRAYLAVIGDITLKEVKPMVENYFTKWGKGDVPLHQYKLPKALSENTVALVDRMNAVQSNIRVTYPVRLKLGSKDQVKATVLNNILGGGFTGRLFMNLREDKGYTYGAYSTMRADPVVGYFSAEAEVGNAVTDSAITEILYEMKRLRTEDVDAQILRETKNYLIGEFSRSLEDPRTTAMFALNIERYWMPKNYYKDYLKNIEAVTVQDVKKMAEKYLMPENAYILVVGKAEDVKDKLTRFNADGKVQFYKSDGSMYDPDGYKAPEGVNASGVIENYIRTIGGRDKLEAIKDITIKAQTSFRGNSLTILTLKKAPNKMVQKQIFGSFESRMVFDGIKGVQISPGQSTEIVGDQLESLRYEAEMNSLLRLDQFWIETELVGEEDVEGRPAYKVKFKPRTGNAWFKYFDKKSNLVVKDEKYVNTPNGTVAQIILFKDYRPVDGIFFPFEFTVRAGDQDLDTQVIFVNINKGIEDSEFEIKF